MTKKILLSSLAASVLASSAFATNGANLIGQGVEARAMGGVGIATYVGTDAVHTNPAMLTANDGNRLDLADTILISSPNVSNSTANVDIDYGTTSALLPNIGYVHNIDKTMVAAFNIAATAGGSVEYDKADGGNYGSLGLMEATPAFAYNAGEFSVGIAVPVAIAMFKQGDATNDFTYDTSISVSYTVGANYNVNKELNVGLVYKGPRTVEATANFTGAASTDDYYTVFPAEYGLGVNYNMGATSLALDVKQILWSTSGEKNPADNTEAGFAAAGGEDQLVIALGAKHALSNELDLMAGLNYGGATISQAGIDAGTLQQFPLHTTTHLTVGADYKINKEMKVGGAFTYALPNTETGADTFGPGLDADYKTSQMAVTVGFSMKL